MPAQAIWGAPGTGKTHTLIHEYLTHRTRGNTVMTTFRRDTADETIENVSELLNVKPSELANNINTIHGICYRLLGGPAVYKVIDSEHVQQFNDETGYKFNYTNNFTASAQKTDMVNCDAWLRNTQTPHNRIHHYPEFRKLRITPTEAQKQLRVYDEWKSENCVIDFTDMLTKVMDSGLTPNVTTLIVDEFQDLTPLQHKIFRMWSEEADNVIVAGDPLQSIYEFWGATAQHFHDFDGQRVVLPRSYRLPTAIWETAKALATRHHMPVPDIETNHSIGTVRYITQREYQAIPAILEGTHTHTVFHLVRSNYQAPAICAMLATHGIMWVGIDGWTPTFLKFLNTLIRVRSGQPLTRADVTILSKQYSIKYFNANNKEALANRIKAMTVAEMETGHGIIKTELYDILRSDDPVLYTTRPGKLKSLKITNALARYSTPVTFADVNTTVTTIHGSKGAERDRVFLHTGITPTIKKSMRRNPTSEASVFYVGITRAKQELYVVKDKRLNYNIPKVTA